MIRSTVPNTNSHAIKTSTRFVYGVANAITSALENDPNPITPYRKVAATNPSRTTTK